MEKSNIDVSADLLAWVIKCTTNCLECGLLMLEGEEGVVWVDDILFCSQECADKDRRRKGGESMEDVIITVNDGVAGALKIPAGVRLVIRDYDIQDDEGLPRDEDGDPYVENSYILEDGEVVLA